jgi:type IV pilus assembly protein PilM
MAARPLGVWGIDLGQCALKAIRLEMKDGQVVATAFEYIEHPKILSQPDADPDELTREALTEFLSRNKIQGDLVTISVPGQSGLARFVKLPPVDEKKVADIVKFEAKQQIPFPLDEVVWDFQKLATGEVVDGMALETEIGLFAMKRDMVFRAIQQFKGVNVEIHVVQMAPLALCNFVAYDLLGKGTDNLAEADDGHECIVCLEIGTDNSNLVITDGGRIIWQRPIPIGGNHFTRALTKEMKLTFAKAEHLKRNAAKSPELKKILGALKQVLNDFVGEVQRSLGYFTNTHRNAKIQYMIGLGNAFRLPGLQKFLQEKLQLEVRKLQHLERATGDTVTTAPTFSENIMSFGVAYGLALQGIKQARLQTNLLPYEVRFERLIRGKKPWAVAAAASLLVGMFLISLAKGMEKSAIENKENKDGAAELKKAAEDAASLESQRQAKDKELKDKEAALKRLGAGVDERLNWQLLHQYVNLITPQPNGTRLSEMSSLSVPVKDRYWTNSKPAQTAYDELQEKLFAKKQLLPDDAQARDLRIKKNLIQINIVGINAMYADDLYSYYSNILRDVPTLLGMDEADKKRVKKYVESDEAARKAIPKEELPFVQGWVIEIRGYTYHHGTSLFVRDTLIENLQFPGKLKDITKNPDLKAQIDKIEGKVKYLLNYETKVVDRPVPGKFELIGGGFLKNLMKNVGPANAAPGPPGNPGVPQGADKPNRDNWRPISQTVAADAFGGEENGKRGGRNAGGESGAAHRVRCSVRLAGIAWHAASGNARRSWEELTLVGPSSPSGRGVRPLMLLANSIVQVHPWLSNSTKNCSSSIGSGSCSARPPSWR